MARDTTIIVGTRGSKLALAQTHIAIKSLASKHPTIEFRVAEIRTTGDLLKTPAQIERALRKGGKGIFAREIENALMRKKIDIAVHSMKDLPVESPDGLRVEAVLPREEPRDVLIARIPVSLERITKDWVIGTSSPRRAAFLRHHLGVKVVPLRGNLDSRIEQLHASRNAMDAIVVSAAGALRLFSGRLPQHSVILPTDWMLPAPAQGAIALQVREDDVRIREIVQAVNDPDTMCAVRAERAILRRIEGGCSVPLGAIATLQDGLLRLDVAIAQPDGSRYASARVTGMPDEPDAIAEAAEVALKGMGGKEILDALAPAPQRLLPPPPAARRDGRARRPAKRRIRR
jgi:hydroxymethylbilane synthase